MNIITTAGNIAFQIPYKVLSNIHDALFSLVARIEKMLQKSKPETRFSLPPDYCWGAEMVVNGERLTFITFVKD